MTPSEQFLENLFQVSPWGLVKAAVLLALGIYIVFAIIIVRQVKLMTNVLNGQMDLPLKTVALIHLVLAIGVFLLSLAIL